MPKNLSIEILKKAVEEKELMHGKLVVGVKEEQWCDRQNFAELYRQWPEVKSLYEPAAQQRKVRWGCLIEGLSGIQFALPEAVEMLENLQTEEQTQSSQLQLISTADPSLPLVGAVVIFDN